MELHPPQLFWHRATTREAAMLQGPFLRGDSWDPVDNRHHVDLDRWTLQYFKDLKIPLETFLSQIFLSSSSLAECFWLIGFLLSQSSQKPLDFEVTAFKISEILILSHLSTVVNYEFNSSLTILSIFFIAGLSGIVEAGPILIGFSLIVFLVATCQFLQARKEQLLERQAEEVGTERPTVKKIPTEPRIHLFPSECTSTCTKGIWKLHVCHFMMDHKKLIWVYKYKLTVRQLQTLVVKVLKGQMDRPKKICVQ